MACINDWGFKNVIVFLAEGAVVVFATTQVYIIRCIRFLMVSDDAFQRIECAIVRKLYVQGCWGKGHLLLIRLTKGVPASDKKFVKDVIKELIKMQIMFAKKTKHGLALYLNKDKLQEIEERIKIANYGQ